MSAAARTCSLCGTQLPGNALGGLCPKCVAALVLGQGPRTEPDRSGAAERSPAANLGDRIGRYRLLERIGQGGCGVVYLAEQEEPVRRQVALKVIKLGMDTREVVARFEAERQALALMDHPNIAKVLDAGATETGRPYFVMELVQGLAITRYCDEKNLSTRRRLELFVQVCQAVQHAHQKGVIHRDIKPSNVLVADPEGVPIPKIIDFGIAKATADQRLTDKTVFTAFEQFIGTPAYMSPEQAKLSGLEVDTRSDIYSLGVLLYELLTGKTPFEAQRLAEAGLDEIRRIIREEEPMRPSTRLHLLDVAEQTTVARCRQSDPPRLLHQIRGDLDWIVMKALEKDRERRYETANGLGQDVRRYLVNEPVVARPPSRLYRLQKTVRRNKLAFGAIAAVALSLMLGLVSSSLLLVRERKEARHASLAALETRTTLSASDFLEGSRLQSEGRLREALAYFTRSLINNPSNGAALARLTTVLAYHSWAVPVRSIKPAHAAEYSPDGASIFTIAPDGASRLWDSHTGQPLTESGRFGTNVLSVRFSADGKRILTVMRDGTLWLWDVQTGKPGGDPARFGNDIHSAEFSPDGKHILTTSFKQIHMSGVEKQDAPTGNVWSSDIIGYSSEHTMKLWDTAGAEAVLESSKQNGLVDSAQYSRDGSTIMTVSPAGATQLWNARDLQPLSGPFGCTNVESLQLSPDGHRVVVVSQDGRVRVWDLKSGKPCANPLATSARVTSARFNPQGDQVITSCTDGTVQSWDAQDGHALTEPLKHGTWANSAQFSPDGRMFLTASSDDTVIIWETVSGPSGTEVLRHDQDVNSAQFSADGTRIVTASADKTARIWDALSGQPLNQPLQHLGRVFAAEFSFDGRRIVTASEDKLAAIWDTQSGRPFILLSRPAEPLPPAAPAQPAAPRGLRMTEESGPPRDEPWKRSTPLEVARFSPDGRKVLTVWVGIQSRESSARIWDSQTGAPLTESLTNLGIITAAQFSSDGKRVLTASQDGTIRVWDAQTGGLLTKPWQHGNWLVTAQFNPEGTKILTASGDKTVRIWDARDGRPLIKPLSQGSELTSAQFSPDGTRIVTTAEDGSARIWDAQTGEPTTDALQHSTALNSAQFSPDGRWIVTVARNGELRVWDVGTGQPLTDPLPDSGFVHAARFSPDGERVIAASSNGTARIWDLAPGPNRCPPWLLQLAEAICGKVLNQQGILEPTRLNRPESISEVRAELQRAQGHDDWTRWGRWFLADPARRTISPFSSIRPGDERVTN
jgi:WD40 repeat protein